jgi:hypothetical protein
MRTDLFKWMPPEQPEPRLQWEETSIGEAVLAVYRDCVDPSYVIENMPAAGERSARAVHAVLAAGAGRRVALEIKALQSFPQQFRAQSLAREILQPIEDELAPRVRRGVSCELPNDPLPIGRKWQCLRDVLPRYIQSVADRLPPGSSRHEVDGVPFAIVLTFDPWLPLPFHFTRSIPDAGAAAGTLVQDVERALAHKRLQLEEHAAAGDRTVLVLVVCHPYTVRLYPLDEAFGEAAQRFGASHLSDVLVVFSEDCNHLSCVALRSKEGLGETLNPGNMVALARQMEH